MQLYAKPGYAKLNQIKAGQIMSNPIQSVYFGGSRSLVFSPVLSIVVLSVLASRRSAHVGCAAGADTLVIKALSVHAGRGRLFVFAAGGSCGSGFWAGSAPLSLLRSVSGSVSWWAGGGAAVPLKARLIKRSVAGFSGCSAAVFFLASPGSSGSLAVAARAVKAGLPVFVFCCGFAGSPAPLANQAGQWVKSSFSGFSCWQWQSAQASLF